MPAHLLPRPLTLLGAALACAAACAAPSLLLLSLSITPHPSSLSPPPPLAPAQGVVAEASSVLGPALRDAVATFHAHGLFLYTWGDANNDYASYMAQKEAGVGAWGVRWRQG